MEIKFQTKQESNREQEEEFLKLTGGERVYAFYDLILKMKRFPTKAKPKENTNFVIEINCENLGRKHR